MLCIVVPYVTVKRGNVEVSSIKYTFSLLQLVQISTHSHFPLVDALG